MSNSRRQAIALPICDHSQEIPPCLDLDFPQWSFYILKLSQRVMEEYMACTNPSSSRSFSETSLLKQKPLHPKANWDDSFKRCHDFKDKFGVLSSLSLIQAQIQLPVLDFSFWHWDLSLTYLHLFFSWYKERPARLVFWDLVARLLGLLWGYKTSWNLAEILHHCKDCFTWS